MRRVCFILVAAIAIGCPSYCHAEPSAKDFSLPSKFGTVKETFFQPNLDPQSERLIIQIQDAHCNYEAQKNLAAILEFLIKERKLKLVMVEGGSGDVGLTFLRSYSDADTRKEVAEKYLKKGQISGEEYLDITSDYDLELYGIEDEDLYDADLNAYLMLESKRQQGLQDLAAIRQCVSSLRQKLYNPQLLEFEQNSERYDSKDMPLSDFCVYLKDKAGRQHIDLTGSHLASYADSVAMEKKIDFKAAEQQRNTFIKDLATKLDEASVKQLVEKTKAFKEGKLQPAEYYQYLRQSSQGKIAMGISYPQLASYIDYLMLGGNFDVADFIKEIATLERKIRESLFSSPDERMLSEVSEAAGVVSKFLTLDLTPEEYETMKASPDFYHTSAWSATLAQFAKRYGLPEPAASSAIDDNFDRLQRFYSLGQEREKAFVKNLNNKMQLSGQKVAVLITGGFHTSGVSRLLRDSGYSYAIVTPTITQKSDSSVYFSVLRGEVPKQDSDDIPDEDK